MSSDTENLLGELEKKVFEKRPVLGRTYKQYGDLSLIEFTQQQLVPTEKAHYSQERKNEVIAMISKHVEGLLGKTIAESVSSQLFSHYFVNTTDHHGPLTDPGFLNNNLITHFAMQSLPESKFRNIIVLSCANVSFDNSSFPRGHLFHTEGEEKVNENQLVFFPRKVRPLTVANNPIYKEDAISNAKKRIQDWVRDGLLKEHHAGKLIQLLDSIYGKPEIFEYQTFSEQVSITNFQLWQKALAVGGESSLIYLEQEKIVNSLLLEHHLLGKTIISRLLFDQKYQMLIEKHLDGIYGGFSLEKKIGTYLFWGLPKDQKYRVQLWRKGDMLTTSDESFRVALRPETILSAIKNGELMPSTLLSFVVLAFYYGLGLIGGGGQTTYLSQMKNAYIRFLKESGNEEEIAFCQNVPTDKQAIPYPSIAFLETSNGEKIPATTVDLFLYGEPDYLSVLEKMSNTIAVREVLARGLPEMYAILTPEEEREPALQGISTEEIDVITGFAEHVQPCGRLV